MYALEIGRAVLVRQIHWVVYSILWGSRVSVVVGDEDKILLIKSLY